MKEDICSAIEGKLLIELEYHGHVRIVEPHVYGMDHHGVERLRGYQVAGGSRSSAPVDWKMFTVCDISSIRLTGKAFSGPRPDYTRMDPVISQIYAQL